jgi:hypothetical protein
VIRAWLVVGADGHEAVFLFRAAADLYATKCHGVVHPLVVKGYEP